MVQLSRDLDCQYKTAFVLAHKLFEAIAQEIHTGEVLEGHIGIDGACFSGHIRPENAKKERKHRRLSIHQTGMGRLRPIGCRHRRFCLIRGVGLRERPNQKSVRAYRLLRREIAEFRDVERANSQPKKIGPRRNCFCESFGGMTALHVALLAPERVRSLTVSSVTAGGKKTLHMTSRSS